MIIYQWESDGLWCDCGLKEMISARQNGFNTRTVYQQKSDKALDLLIEINDYLDYHKNNAIHSGSKLHMKVKEELK